jgi:hypothetical protein
MRHFLVIGLCLSVIGCSNQPTWRDPDQHIEEQGMYCYETLGGVDCYKRPLKQCVRQPIGHTGPPPPEIINE